MQKFYDRAGLEINEGNVIVYDEGEGYAKSIDEIVVHAGELAGIKRVSQSRVESGRFIESDERQAHPTPLIDYEVNAIEKISTTVIDAEKSRAFTPEFAYKFFTSKV
jgi:hypothetical protein